MSFIEEFGTLVSVAFAPPPKMTHVVVPGNTIAWLPEPPLPRAPLHKGRFWDFIVEGLDKVAEAPEPMVPKADGNVRDRGVPEEVCGW